jgi:hypothetical protein
MLFRAVSRKDGVVLAVRDERGRLPVLEELAEVRKDFVVLPDFIEHVEHNVFHARPTHEGVVDDPVVGIDGRRVVGAGEIHLLDAFHREERRAHLLTMFGRAVLPIRDHRIPERTRFIGVGGRRILHDQTCDTIGMLQRDAVANRSAEIMDVDRVLAQAHFFDKVVDDVGEVVERIGEDLSVRRIAVSERRIVGSNNMIAITERRNCYCVSNMSEDNSYASTVPGRKLA